MQNNDTINVFEKYINNNKGRFLDKHSNYAEVYNRHLRQYIGKPVNILEIGIYQGGSLQMWKHCFGDKCNVFGVDINPDCRKYGEDRISVFIGNQENRTFLRDLKKKIPPLDIFIDDGGHTMKQQINTFEELFPHLKENGVYICEDICTSYWKKFGGGYLKKDTFIEYSKNFIDYINAWHSTDKNKLSVSDFTKSVYSLHFYDSILVIQKRPVNRAYQITTGQISNEQSTMKTRMSYMLSKYPWLHYHARRLYNNVRLLKSKFI